MNLLYCGDANIIDGLVISILSLLKNTDEELHIFVFTMRYENKKKKYEPLSSDNLKVIEEVMKKKNKNNFLKLIDVTDEVNSCPPEANIKTFFTPYCMLRLYADLVPDLPDKILYLDNDVVCLKDPKEFYHMDNSEYEIVGALDYYGSHVYRKKIFKKDYLNSGVLLLNLKLVRETGLLEKCRELCKKQKMMLPDQSALNWFSKQKLIVDRIYNEQKQRSDETVFRHFSTTFRFWPKICTQTIKPWHIDKLHDVLQEHSFDDILEEYKLVMERMKL